MTHEELKILTIQFLADMLRIENEGERVCECGEVILDPEKSLTALLSILSITSGCVRTIIELDGPGARLHAPVTESDEPPVRFH